MKRLLLALVILGLSSAGYARELDDESSVTNRQIKGTMILRVDKRTHKADYVKTDQTMTSKDKAKVFVKNAKFNRVPAANIKSELDRSGGSSSWYFYDRGYDRGYGRGGYDGGYGRGGYDGGYDGGYGRGGYNGGYGNYYNNPYCNYYGSNYQPYYNYNNGYYSYYYYSDCYWNRGGYGCGY